MVTEMICNFCQIPENMTSPKIGWNVPCHARVDQACTSCRGVLDCSAGIRLDNIFRQQQAKNHKESCGQNIGDSLQDKAEQVQCTIKQYNIFGKHKQSIKLFIIFYVSDQNNLLFISFMIFMLQMCLLDQMIKPVRQSIWHQVY